ncbi:syntaxin-like protein [Mycena pura]|uniref:Syntaxin-like protein n=1 Tax=Mycena pura TaxID=153505 RepID=A0AAD6Y1K9_9AGAR|nr:syntaxin-like protein [Mycena pura]
MMVDQFSVYTPHFVAPAQVAADDSRCYELTILESCDASTSLDGMPAFLAEASFVQDAIASVSANVARIGKLSTRALDAIGDDGAAVKSELDPLVEDTMARSNVLKARIKRLQEAAFPRGAPCGEQEAEMRHNRVAHVRAKFTEALQKYQLVEQECRAKARQRMDRQLRVVKPKATPEEMAEAVTGDGDTVFIQAVCISAFFLSRLCLTSSPIYARSSYSDLQARAKHIRKMEQILGELAQVFNDMAMIVDQQDEKFVTIEISPTDVEANVKEGLKEMTRAVESARTARKMRKRCFFVSIVLTLVIILAVVLAVVLTVENANTN